jgi:TolA-binding protein
MMSDAHYNLGALFKEEKNYVEAKKHYFEVLTHKP